LRDAVDGASNTIVVRAKMFSPDLAPNPPVPDLAEQMYTGSFHARSNHPSSVNGPLADGGVRFVTDAIAEHAWRALGTCRGGEVPTTF
jgi:hypothetical protein